jgi:N-acetylneuraminic acid mutarotase
MDLDEGKMNEFNRINLSNITEAKWEKVETLGAKPESSAFFAGVLVDDIFYLFGGENMVGEGTNNLYIYNINDNKWEKRIFIEKDMISLVGHTLNYYKPNNSLITFGGFYKGVYLNDIYYYEIKNNQWNKEIYKLETKLPIGRINHTTNTINNFIYIFAGKTKDGVMLSDMWRFNLDSKIWEEIKLNNDIPRGRSGHTSINFKNSLYIFGGKVGNIQETNELWKFDLNSNSFILLHDSMLEQHQPQEKEETRKKYKLSKYYL